MNASAENVVPISEKPESKYKLIEGKFNRKTLVFNGGDENTKLCGELKVIGKARDANGGSWSTVIEMLDQDGITKRLMIANCDIAADQQKVMRELVDKGLFVFGGKNVPSLIIGYLRNSHSNRLRIIEKTGWHGDSFVLANKVYGKDSFFLRDNTDHNAQSGTVASWRDNVGKLCKGNSRLTFAASVGFASPFLELDNQDGGGFHFVGGSSRGKTKAAQICASVWRKELNQWRATGNGLEGIASLHSDTSMAFDELGESDPREIGEVIYMLANGSGKTRASRNGNAKDARTWKLLFVSTGEKSLSEHIRDGGKQIKTGQEIRLAEVQADAGKGFGLFDDTQGLTGGQFADLISEQTKLHHGAVGPALIRTIVSNRVSLKNACKEYRQNFIRLAGIENADGQVKRVAGRFSLVAMAGEHATTSSLTGWKSGDAVKAALTCFKSWQSNWAVDGSRESERAIDQVRAFIQEHESRFNKLTDERPANHRAGFLSNGEYWIIPKVFNSEVCSGLRATTVKQSLKAANYLITDNDGKSSARRVAIKRQRFYVISSAILEGSENV